MRSEGQKTGIGYLKRMNSEHSLEVPTEFGPIQASRLHNRAFSNLVNQNNDHCIQVRNWLISLHHVELAGMEYSAGDWVHLEGPEALLTCLGLGRDGWKTGVSWAPSLSV